MTDITLSTLQDRGSADIAEWFRSCIPNEVGQKFYLGGYAGTGKTSIIPSIIDRCKLNFQDVAFCAPTGKAAKVITGKLRGMYNTSEIKAKTIHSSIYIPARAKVEALREEVKALEDSLGAFQMRAVEFMNDMDAFKQRCDEMERKLEDKKDEFDAANRAYRRSGPSFVLNTDAPIRDCKLIVVDEASMVGEDIAQDLMEFGVPVLAIGDPAQLPPVGDKPGLAVGRPDFFLDEIHRQARDNPIIQLSMDIREGKSIKTGKMGDKVTIVSRHKDDWTLNPDYNAQVICGTHKRRWGLTSKIRKMCGYDSNAPMVDEPLLVCKNSKKYENLVNGSFVTCDVSPGELTEGHASFEITITDELGDQYSMDVYQGTFEEHKAREKDFYTAPQFEAFDAKRKAEMLDFGWVITAHKSQGSQWDNVIVHDESGVFKQDAKNWLYTAVTRAADELVVVV